LPKPFEPILRQRGVVVRIKQAVAAQN